MEALRSKAKLNNDKNKEFDKLIPSPEFKSKGDESIIGTATETLRNLADSALGIIGTMWKTTNVAEQQEPKNMRSVDVEVDVEAFIVYDQTIDGDFVEVELTSNLPNYGKDRHFGETRRKADKEQNRRKKYNSQNLQIMSEK